MSPAVSPAEQDALRARGIQVTPQRLAVLRAVEAQPHATADQVLEAARHTLGSMSRQAVYDALELLVTEGLIRRIQPMGSRARFEGRIGDNHHHVVCRACGSLADVDCATGEAPCLVAVDDAGFVIDEAEVIYWGLCPSCASTSSSTNVHHQEESGH